MKIQHVHTGGVWRRRMMYCGVCQHMTLHLVKYEGYSLNNDVRIIHISMACYEHAYLETKKGIDIFSAIKSSTLQMNDWAALVNNNCFKDENGW
jgi:hypothetical protein